MPGIVQHILFANEIYRKLKEKIILDEIEFISGNLIPDLAIEKNKSHYRQNASEKGFFVPNMQLAKKELFMPDDSIKLGMYCHLYLDYHFIEDFLISKFIWNHNNMTVTNPKNSKTWTIKTFFSQSGLYKSYSEMNEQILSKNHLSIVDINKIPHLLPTTGIDIFDNRRSKTWKTELDEYFSEELFYTGEILDYDQFYSYIQTLVEQFLQEFPV